MVYSVLTDTIQFCILNLKRNLTREKRNIKDQKLKIKIQLNIISVEKCKLWSAICSINNKKSNRTQQSWSTATTLWWINGL